MEPQPPIGGVLLLGSRLLFLEEELVRRVTRIIVTNGVNAVADGRGHAEALLVKRDAFAHEQEVRLLYVEPKDSASLDLLRFVGVDPHALFDELTLDPRLGADDVEKRTAEFRSYGYAGSVNKALLYQRVLSIYTFPEVPGCRIVKRIASSGCGPAPVT